MGNGQVQSYDSDGSSQRDIQHHDSTWLSYHLMPHGMQLCEARCAAIDGMWTVDVPQIVPIIIFMHCNIMSGTLERMDGCGAVPACNAPRCYRNNGLVLATGLPFAAVVRVLKTVVGTVGGCKLP